MRDALPLILASASMIGWALIHFAWQACLLGFLYWLVRPMLPRGQVRYRAGMAMLLAFAACPLLTLWRLLDTATPAIGLADAVTATTDVPGHGATGSPWIVGGAGMFGSLLPWLALGWLLGVLVLSHRAWRQWCGLKALVRVAERMPRWQERVDVIAQRFRLRRRVTVLRCKFIATPALVGWLRPVILLPVAVACGFPAAQIELILAHELAHLRRWDPLANLFQVIIETLHFYHPVVHWISRDVRNEREICCDELTLSMGGSRHDYVTALADLGELREQQSSLLLAAGGGVLLDRVQHLLGPEGQVTGTRAPARFVSALVGAGLLALLLQLGSQQASPQRELGAIELQSMLAPAWLPTAFSVPMWRLIDLAPVRAEAARPLTALPTPLSAEESIASPRAPMTLLHSMPIQVADLVPSPARTIQGIHLFGHTSSGSAPPAPLNIRQPIYPWVALRNGVEGSVVVEFGLTASGGVEHPTVVSAQPQGVFEHAALEALSGWRYAAPAAGDRRRYRQTMAFTLHGASPEAELHVKEQISARDICRAATGTHICRQFH